MEDRDMDELTVSQIAREYRLNRNTVNKWIRGGQLTARPEFGELNIRYYLVKRGDLDRFLQSRPRRGRPLKRTP